MTFPYHDGGTKIPMIYKNNNKDCTVTNLYVNGTIVTTSGDVTGQDVVTVTPSTVFPNARTFAVGPSLSLTDGGPGGNLTADLPNLVVAGTVAFPSDITFDVKGRLTGVGATAADLQAIEALAGVGIPARTAADTWAQVAIFGGSSSLIGVTNGDGVAGNPTVEKVGTQGFSAIKSGNQAITTGTSTTVASWSTAAPGFDQTSGAFNTTTGVFTCAVAGAYRCTFHAVWQVSNVGTRRIARFLRNGAALSGTVQDPAIATNFGDGQSLNQETTCLTYLAVNDTLVPSVFHNVGGNSNILATDAVTNCKTLFSVTLEAAF